MAKERLSKQQKWILITCYKTIGRLKGWENGYLFRSEIIDGYYSKTSDKAEASLSRAIRSLIDKGLVSGYTPRVLEYSKKTERKLSDKRKPDLAEVLKEKIKREVKDPSTEQILEAKKRYDETIGEYLEKFNPSDKLLSQAIYRKETIKVIALTDIGKEAARCLMLSNELKAKLNNRGKK